MTRIYTDDEMVTTIHVLIFKLSKKILSVFIRG
jgi:hypothetical protein